MPLSQRATMAELDVVSRWLWLVWRVLLFCSLLGSPMPLTVPDGLLRLSQALRSLRRALPTIESQRVETPYPFRPEDGDLLRLEYQTEYGPQGQLLVQQLGGQPAGYPAAFAELLTDSPKEYLTPPHGFYTDGNAP